MTYPQMKFVIDHYTQLQPLFKTIICCLQYDTIDILDNKNRFGAFMLQNNFRRFIPQYDIQYPCIQKPIQSFGRKQCIIHLNNESIVQEEMSNKKYVFY